MEHRVAYLVNQYPKVSHSFIRREILALEQSGLSVSRFALRGWDDATITEESDVAEGRLTTYLLSSKWRLLAAGMSIAVTRPVTLLKMLATAASLSRQSARPWYAHCASVLEACLLWQFCRQREIAHIHAHFGTNATEVAMLARHLGHVDYSFTVHGPEEFDAPASLALSEKIEAARFVVAISSFCRSQLYRWTSVSHWPKIHVVRCGIDHGFKHVQTAPPSGQIFLCIGRLCEQKGQLLLVQAFHALLQTHPDARLILAGDGDMRPDIESELRRLNLTHQVTITGWINGEEIRRLLDSSRCMVLPSFAEGLPVVIMEALACERPVITTAIAGIPELVRHGETGWLCAAGDVSELTAAMQACLNTPEHLISTMGKTGRTRVLAQHDIDQEAVVLGNLLKTCGRKELA